MRDLRAEMALFLVRT